jgi:hypothetical protein
MKAYSRKLATGDEFKDLKARYEALGKRLNNYNNYIEEQAKKNPLRNKP